MTGRLIAVVGPSGVGKDSLMRALADTATAAPGVGLVRRVITRAPGLGGEEFEPISDAAFEARAAAGGFCLHWRAHGLGYGIPGDLAHRLAGGTDLLVNLSRGVLAEASRAFPGLIVLNVTAAPETLALRLAGRGRETAAEIAARLSRAGHGLPDGIAAVTIRNDGPLIEAVAQAMAVLYPGEGAATDRPAPGPAGTPSSGGTGLRHDGNAT